MRLTIFFLAVLLSVTTAVSQPGADISAMIDKGEFDAAAARIAAVLRSRPNDLNTLTQKVRLLVIKKQYAETETLANRIIARDPRNKIALNARGVAKRDGKKDFAAALADFDKALAIDAEYPQASFNRAVTIYYGKLGKKSDALDAFSAAIEINPENATARAMRGRLLNEAGKYQLALLDLNQALSINKTLPAYADRAYAKFMMYVRASDSKLLADVAKDVDTALLADPSNAAALALRACVKYIRGDADGTLADAKKALQIDPNSFISYMALGFLKTANKDDGWIDEFEAAQKIAPNNFWVNERLFALARSAKDSSPRAAAIYRAQLARNLQSLSDKIELSKLVVEDEPWDYAAYNRVDDAFRAYSKAAGDAERAGLTNVPSSIDRQKAERDFWHSLHAKNPKNHCVGLFKYSHIDIDQNGRYDPNRRTDDASRLRYLKRELDNYDGTNGAECAARTALFIADIYQTTYSPEKNFDLARQFTERSKQIKADLKDDPNVISGVATTAAESTKNIEYWQAQDDAWKKELERIKQSGSSSAGGSGSRRRSGVDPAKEQAAIAAYERVHPQIERLAEQIISAAGKVQSGGSLSFTYRGTRQRITNLQRQMVDIHYNFMQVHGPYLPDSLANHINSDVRRVGNLRNDLNTGEVYKGGYDSW